MGVGVGVRDPGVTIAMVLCGEMVLARERPLWLPNRLIKAPRIDVDVVQVLWICGIE